MRKRLVAYAWSVSCATAMAGLLTASCAHDAGQDRGSEQRASSILTIPAGSETQAAFAVTAWRLDLGPQGLLMTGVDSGGNAVRGALLAFTGPELPTQMLVEMQDGSLRAQVFTLNADGTAGAVEGSLSDNQALFVGRALVDIGTYEIAQGTVSGASLDPRLAAAGLHALGGSSPDCGQQYGNDAYNIALGGLGCASLFYSGGGSGIVRAVGSAAQFSSKIGKGIHLPNCADAAKSFFDLGTCGSTSCFQVASACPSCDSSSHLDISPSTGAGTCAPGAATTPQQNGCPAGQTRLPGVNHKPGQCCSVCGGGSGTSGGTMPQDVMGDMCPIMSDGGAQEGGDGGADGGSDGGNSEGGGSDGAGSESGSGSDGGTGADGGGSDGGYAFVERAPGRHRAFAVAAGLSTVIPFTWRETPGMAAPFDLSVAFDGAPMLQIASEDSAPFARAGLDVIPLEPGENYELELDRTADIVHATLSSRGRSLLERDAPVSTANADSTVDVTVPEAPWRTAVEIGSR